MLGALRLWLGRRPRGRKCRTGEGNGGAKGGELNLRSQKGFCGGRALH